MAKTASVTVRIPEALKRQIEKRAAREHRSLSSQVEHELTLLFNGEDAPAKPKQGGKLLGRFAGTKVPTDEDFKEVRQLMWARLRGE